MIEHVHKNLNKSFCIFGLSNTARQYANKGLIKKVSLRAIK
jgi:hypothetical protein